MLKKSYKYVLYSFISYVLILNVLTFLSSGSLKALINPFHLKSRTVSMYHLATHVFFVAGLGFVTSTPEEVNALIDVACKKYDADPRLIRIMIKVESKGKQFAISRTGAMGLMQVMPNTFFDISDGDPFLAEDNIDAGVKYIAKQLKRFEDVPLALAAYNAGPNNIKDGKIPDFGETKSYIKKIMAEYQP